MNQQEFEDMMLEIRGHCFHMNDEEATEIIDEYIGKYPDSLKFQTREWMIMNS